MNYKPFLTRDFKSLGLDKPKIRKWNKLHWFVIVALITSITTLLIFASKDVSAKRNETSINTPINMAAPAQQAEANNQITLPLALLTSGEAPSSNPPKKIARPDIDEKHINQVELKTPVLTSTTTFQKLEAQKAVPLHAWHDEKVQRGDSLAQLFKRNHLSPKVLHNIMQLGKETKALKYIQPGQLFKFRVDQNKNLIEMVYQQNRFQSLHVKRVGGSYKATTISREAQKRKQYISGRINSSLFVDAKNAGMNDPLIMDLVSIFGWDIDFALDLRKGDSFSLIYEEHFLDGLKIKDGNILAAEFSNQGRIYRAVRFTDPSGRSNYYTPKGLSMRKAFLRTPVDFRRISSRFGNRKHPVLNRMRLHKGVDYSASRGTPIKASGDGKIIFRGRKGGYGKAIIIRHGGRYSTLYAHMNSYKRGLYSGKYVKQGQVIGYVGSTGRATGPHLHYEFRINGSHRNPLTVKLPNAAPINKNYKIQFKQHASNLLSELNAFNFKLASANYATKF